MKQISPEQRDRILESLRVGCDLEESCKAQGVTAEDARKLMGADEGWRADVVAATGDGADARKAAFAEVAAHSASLDAVAPAKAVQVIHVPEGMGRDAKRFEDIAGQAARFAPGPFGYLLWTDAQCTLAGFPPMSAWWRYSTREFYASGKPWGIFLVGRGGGKSTTLERCAASDARFVERKVFPGQVWTWPFISVGPDDANRRITGIAAVFRACGLNIIGEDDGEGGKWKEGVKVARSPRGSLELTDAIGNDIQLASIAGTIGNVSGPSTTGMTIDEAAKLLDKGTNANPLTEIIASGAQTSRARAGWRAICCSSAMWTTGAHYELIRQGDNASNYVAKIGAEFLDETVRGFESVASWESARGDATAAKLIRDHAASLTEASPFVPTHLANPTLGNPDGAPWEGAALASRMLVDALPEAALGGVPRIVYWLRENGSVPMPQGDGDDGMSAKEQLIGIRDRMRARRRMTGGGGTVLG